MRKLLIDRLVALARRGISAVAVVVALGAGCATTATNTVERDGTELGADSSSTQDPDDGTLDPAQSEEPTAVAASEPTTEGATATPEPQPTTEAATSTPEPQATATPTAAPVQPASDDSVVPPPTPTALPSVAPGPCTPGDELRFDVVDVAIDDPDGGLVVHTEMGIDAPVVGVLPWHARGVWFLGQCDFTPSGAEWWQVSWGAQSGWVNSRFLGQRHIPGDDLAATACATDGVLGTPAPEPTGTVDATTNLAISDVRVESSMLCDRIVVELGSGWSFDSPPKPLDRFPADVVTGVLSAPGELRVQFNAILASAFDSRPPAASWRDAATDEQNVALVLDRDEQPELHVAFGSGSVAGVRFEHAPARVIVDVVQTPTPDGIVVGPIVAGNAAFGPILFDPVVPTLAGPGIEQPFVVRGFSRGFEGSSVIDIRPWSQTSADHPGAWQGLLFGRSETVYDTPRPAGLTFDPPLPSWASADYAATPFTTSGYFEFEVSGLAASGWQLAVVPSTGLGCPSVVGQQFRVAGALDAGNGDGNGNGNGNGAAMVPFSLSRAEVVDGVDLQATTTTSVLGVDWVTRGAC